MVALASWYWPLDRIVCKFSVFKNLAKAFNIIADLDRSKVCSYNKMCRSGVSMLKKGLLGGVAKCNYMWANEISIAERSSCARASASAVKGFVRVPGMQQIDTDKIESYGEAQVL